ALGSWSLTPKVKLTPERLHAVAWVRRLGPSTTAACAVVAVALPLLFTSSSQEFLLTRVLIYALIALSVTVLVGWAGQLSLGQFAFVGLGAVVATAMVGRGVGFPAAVAFGAVAGAAAAVVVGFPALRVRGPFLGVTTLAFAVASQGWLFG